jgi:hypothetical protein
MTIYILRDQQTADYTSGLLWVVDNKGRSVFHCKTLELPWFNNRKQMSCIPAGIYTSYLHHSPKFGNCISIPNVPGRSEILLHVGNFVSDTKGCILVGKARTVLHGMQTATVHNSKIALRELLSFLPNKFVIHIYTEPN